MDGQDIAQWLGIGTSFIGITGAIVTAFFKYGDYREWKKGIEKDVEQLKKDSEKRDEEHYERICHVLDKHAQ